MRAARPLFLIGIVYIIKTEFFLLQFCVKIILDWIRLTTLQNTKVVYSVVKYIPDCSFLLLLLIMVTICAPFCSIKRVVSKDSEMYAQVTWH